MPPGCEKPSPTRYPCKEPACESTFSRPSDVDRHMQLHKPVDRAKWYECSFKHEGCKYAGNSQKINRDRHEQRIHIKSVQATCYACAESTTFTDTSAFDHHCTRVHGYKAMIVREYNNYWLKCKEGEKGTIPMLFEEFLLKGLSVSIPVPVLTKKKAATTRTRKERRDHVHPYLTRSREPKVEETEALVDSGSTSATPMSRASSESAQSRSVCTPFEEVPSVEPVVYDPVQAQDSYTLWESSPLPDASAQAAETLYPPPLPDKVPAYDFQSEVPQYSLPPYTTGYGDYAQTSNYDFINSSGFGYGQPVGSYARSNEQASYDSRAEVGYDKMSSYTYGAGISHGHQYALPSYAGYNYTYNVQTGVY